MYINSIASTNVGTIRQNNEDNFYLCGQYRADTDTPSMTCTFDEKRERYLFGVCDGMGGEANGELASLIAVRLFDEYTGDFKDSVERYVEQANAEICSEIERRGGKRMGTTFAALEIAEGKAFAYNIGDSRIYHISENGIRRISEDHTQIRSLIKQGFVSEEAAKSHPARHVLTQHLGIFPDEMIIEPYAAEAIDLKAGDMFLLCSDGLTDMLSDGDILSAASGSGTLKEKAEALIEAALNAGGRDNVTVLLLSVCEDAPADPEECETAYDAAEALLKRCGTSAGKELVDELCRMLRER